MLNVLIAHSSAELYGSDKSLLDFVRYGVREMRVTVALPEKGPLYAALEAAGAKVCVGEVCKVQRKMFSPNGLLRTCTSLFGALRFLHSIRPAGGFDLVYSNSIAVLGGGLYAALVRLPHVWHVREILSQSKMLSRGFRFLVSALSKKIICNSSQTLDWIAAGRNKASYVVVWNGFDGSGQPMGGRELVRRELGADSAQDVLFVLVGRVNAWKGQRLLVEAFSDLVRGGAQGIRLALVGSAAKGQEAYEEALSQAVTSCGCKDWIKLCPFREDVDAVWAAADVAVVPSIEPEPFGRVAIEAMGFGLPVVAAGHGGLLDIVQDGKTGLLVVPGDRTSLCIALRQLAADESLRRRLGGAGRARQQACFSVTAYAESILNILKGAVSPH